MSALELVVEFVGWAGAALILLAYLLLSAGKLAGQSRAYQAMNLVGAIGFVINGYWHRAMPSTILNIIWAGIALFALYRIGVKASATKG